MTKDTPVDSYVASKMCDIVESLTRLENAVTYLRVHLVCGETQKMNSGIYMGRKHARELRQHLDSLDAALDEGFLRGQKNLPTLVQS